VEDLLKSALRFSWAMSLFGTRQMGEMMLSMGTGRPTGRAVSAFDRLTRAAEDQLGSSFGGVFRTADRWQRRAVDLGFDLATPPPWMTRAALDAFLQGGETTAGLSSRVLPPGEDAWLEVRDKLHAFRIFRTARSRLGLSRATSESLAHQVEKARDVDTWVAVWALEGLGYAYSEDVWKSNRIPRELLTNRDVGKLPGWGVLALHTGMGLSFAERVLSVAQPSSSDRELARALERLDELCASNAREGLSEAAFEAVGLIAQGLFPQTLDGLDRELEARWPERRAALWHGVGRGLYFAPTQAWPGSLWRGVERCRDEPAHRLGRLNALSGLIWAAMLITLRRPGSLADFLDRHGDELSEEEEAAFAAGVVSASAVWWASSPPGDEHLDAFCRHRPKDGVELWERLVVEPCTRAEKEREKLRDQKRLGELFAYRPEEG